MKKEIHILPIGHGENSPRGHWSGRSVILVLIEECCGQRTVGFTSFDQLFRERRNWTIRRSVRIGGIPGVTKRDRIRAARRSQYRTEFELTASPARDKRHRSEKQQNEDRTDPTSIEEPSHKLAPLSDLELITGTRAKRKTGDDGDAGVRVGIVARDVVASGARSSACARLNDSYWQTSGYPHEFHD